MSLFKIERLGSTKQTWHISQYGYIGKNHQCLIQLSDEQAPEKLALLEIKESQLQIRDLRSPTGTWVNGTRVIEAILKDGDIITSGKDEFIVHQNTTDTSVFPLQSRCEYWNLQLQSLAHVSATNHPVLLLGPSGAGKDVIAQKLHETSLRKRAPLMSVNCSALTETLIESELFGHIKGSFTGAISDRKGAFESARHGTLFLDEIGDLPYSLQSKLLRALENNEIRPVGSDRNIKTDVRIIAATHQNLYHKIREGSFRSDLFYRLNVITVEVPSLKERLDDFDDLIYQFAKQYRVRFSFGAIQKLKKHEWHGNIRELKNVVVRASALMPKQYVEEQHIDIILNKKDRIAHASAGVAYLNSNEQPNLSVIKEIEKQMIVKRLLANNGNQKRTAADLGMPKSTLHDRIKTYNIAVDKLKV